MNNVSFINKQISTQVLTSLFSVIYNTIVLYNKKNQDRNIKQVSVLFEVVSLFSSFPNEGNNAELQFVLSYEDQ